MLKDTVKELLKEINTILVENSADTKMPRNTFFMKDDGILCAERKIGESRFPYYHDGLVLWAYSTGYITANECNMKIFRTTRLNEESCIDFFAGIEMADNKYFPISITGATKQMYEPEDIKRYTVFQPENVFYITDTEKLVFALRIHISKSKEMHFSLCAINKTDENIKFYFSSYMEPQIGYANDLGYWERMAVTGKCMENGSTVINRNAFISRNIIVRNKKIFAKNVLSDENTAARGAFVGTQGHGLFNADALRMGHFDRPIDATTRIDFPVFCDIVHFDIEPEELVREEFVLAYTHKVSEIDELTSRKIDIDKIDKELVEKRNENAKKLDSMTISFDDFKDDTLNTNVINRFVKSVQKQVSFCATNKEFGGRYLGMRDVFQQLEGAVLWQPEDVREKFCILFNYIYDTGRTARSVTMELGDDIPIFMVSDEYIDQGLWAISCVYTYLAYTNDYSLLDEVCGYYHLSDNEQTWTRTEEKTTILEHLMRMMKYLISNIDTKYNTHCLRILKGDWNDSIDGLGASLDKDEKFGSGVSVMATMQLYQNLREMMDILSHIGGYEDVIAEYKTVYDNMSKGLLEFAVDTSGNERQIIHGWGDKISYKVGSFSDEDGKRRHSLIANAFWVLGGMLEKDISLKEDILKTYSVLDSRYGYKTFEPAFTADMNGVGRMKNILPGNAENACAYVHASMFANMSLFMMGEPALAWKQLKKSITVTHENTNTSPYVMCNQYCDNKEYNIDGEAISDWATGSGAVLIKGLVKYGFGIAPDLDDIVIALPKVMPAKKAKISIKICGYDLVLDYENTDNQKRKIEINDEIVCGQYDDMLGTEKIVLKKSDIQNTIKIKITD